MVLKGPSFVVQSAADSLTAESVQGTSLTLEGIDNIHGRHCFPLGVFGVRYGIIWSFLAHILAILCTSPPGKRITGRGSA